MFTSVSCNYISAHTSAGLENIPIPPTVGFSFTVFNGIFPTHNDRAFL